MKSTIQNDFETKFQKNLEFQKKGHISDLLLFHYYNIVSVFIMNFKHEFIKDFFELFENVRIKSNFIFVISKKHTLGSSDKNHIVIYLIHYLSPQFPTEHY